MAPPTPSAPPFSGSPYGWEQLGYWVKYELERQAGEIREVRTLISKLLTGTVFLTLGVLGNLIVTFIKR